MGTDWVDEKALEALKMESAVFGEGLGSQTNPEIAERLFDENVVGATMSIIHIARCAPNDNLRFKAAQYIVDRVLGASKKDPQNKDMDPLNRLIQELHNTRE